MTATSLAIQADRLALPASLVESARDYYDDAWAKRTQQSYLEQWRAFERWCEQHGREPLPATPDTVIAYVTARADAGRKVSTISLGLAAIGHAHAEAGYDSPRAHRAVKHVMKGIRRRLGVAPRQKAPLLGDQLRALARELPETTIGVRDRALLLLGFAGAFRRSELVGLTVADLAFSSDGVAVALRRTKTDQEGVGRDVPIPFGRARETCPVRSLQHWLEVAGISEGPVFRVVGRHGDVRGALSGRDVAAVVKRRVQALGLDPARFAGHSLRAGLATSAARAGKAVHSIQAVTGHKSANMVMTYVRAAKLFDDVASEGLL